MNAKKAKALRAIVRSAGEDPRHSAYVLENSRAKRFQVGFDLQPDGTHLPRFVDLTTHSVRLAPSCGRAAYRLLKGLAA